MPVVSTIEDRCKACYSCVRQCPVKAIKVEVGQSRVVPERCISCGSCIKACSQNAKQVFTFLPQVEEYLQQAETIALLAPSFPASIYPVSPEEFYDLLKQIGFSQVYELTIGVELTMPPYREFIAHGPGTLISSHCTAVVNLIEKHFPALLKYLAPVDSALMATAKLVRHRHRKSRLVFIGPCIAKKEEALEQQPGGILDAVVTFKELKELFRQRGLWPSAEEQDVLSMPPQREKSIPSLFPLPRGLIKNLDPAGNWLSEEDVAQVEGKENCMQFLKGLQEGRMHPRVVDILFCDGGCINGPEMDSELDLFTRKFLVYQYAHQKERDRLGRLPPLDLERTFTNKEQILPVPSEREILQILKYTNKTKPEDELNCGACGYNSCREKAVAVYQGLAEVDMCLPYLLEQSRGELEFCHYKLQLKGLKDLLVGNSPSMHALRQLAVKTSSNDATLLILGESGVGKEVFARAVHHLGPRSEKPFVAINCAALPEHLLESELFGYEEGAFTGARKGGKPGKFELARDGTLLLDEIGDLSPAMQSKLLRVLQEREFERVGGTKTVKLSARIMAATNRELKELVDEGKFRGDLYYRLNVIGVNVPALRRRKDDIPLLIDHFIARLAQEKKIQPKIFSEQARQLLMYYDWPGNVRELRNVVEQSLYICEGSVILTHHLPEFLCQGNGKRQSRPLRPLKEAVRQLERKMIMEALEKTKYNKADAASLLGMPRATFYLKLKEYNVH